MKKGKKILIALLLTVCLAGALFFAALTIMARDSEEVMDNFAINQLRKQLLLYHEAYAVLPPDIESLIAFVGPPEAGATSFQQSVNLEYQRFGRSVEVKRMLYNPHADFSDVVGLSNLVAASPVAYGWKRRAILLTEKNKDGECLVKEKIPEWSFCKHWQYDNMWQLERKK